MEEIAVDARGKTCPEPLIMTKKALATLPTGSRIKVLIDNTISKNNVQRFLTDNDIAFSCSEENGVFVLLATKSKEDLAKPDAESFCVIAPVQSSGSHVIAVSQTEMGSGSPELGAILMKAFVNTIKEVSPLPSSIIFYNSGIYLAAEGSTLIESLKELEGLGVTVLVCGTCVNYFNKQEQIRVGTISNMYTILETLTRASHIVTP